MAQVKLRLNVNKFGYVRQSQPTTWFDLTGQTYVSLYTGGDLLYFSFASFPSSLKRKRLYFANAKFHVEAGYQASAIFNILAAADGVLTNLRSDNVTFSAVVDDLRSDFLNRNDTDAVFNTTSSNFGGGSRDDECLFQQQFKTVKEFQESVEAVADKGNRYLQGVSAIHSRLEETEEIIDEICDVVKRRDTDANISRSQLDILSKAARAWAVLFDHYSVVINDVSRLDHNLTLDLKRMIDTLHV